MDDQPFQPVIDEAIGPQHRDQRIGANQQIGPEGQDDEQQQPHPHIRFGKDNRNGDRKGDHEADRRRRSRHPDRLPEDAEIERFERARILVQVPVERGVDDAGLRAEAVEPDQRERNDEEGDQPEGRRRKGSPEGACRSLPVVHAATLPRGINGNQASRVRSGVTPRPGEAARTLLRLPRQPFVPLSISATEVSTAAEKEKGLNKKRRAVTCPPCAAYAALILVQSSSRICVTSSPR